MLSGASGVWQGLTKVYLDEPSALIGLTPWSLASYASAKATQMLSCIQLGLASSPCLGSSNWLSIQRRVAAACMLYKQLDKLDDVRKP